MNTCGTCKYFGESYQLDHWTDNDHQTFADYHYCELVKHINGYDYEEVPFKQYVAGVIDGSGYHATLCNQWCAK